MTKVPVWKEFESRESVELAAAMLIRTCPNLTTQNRLHQRSEWEMEQW